MGEGEGKADEYSAWHEYGIAYFRHIDVWASGNQRYSYKFPLAM